MKKEKTSSGELAMYRRARKYGTHSVTATQVLVMDEAQLMQSSREYQGLLERCAPQVYRPNAASMATQAVMCFNSGKRVRFLFQHRRADGSPIKPPPQKFIPAQVLRRAIPK